MKFDPQAPRNTGGFSLDDAARAFRLSVRHDRPAVCPHCLTPMHPLVGDQPAESVWILRCPMCRRGLVLNRSSWSSEEN
jgi:hypothetical protein